MLFKPDEPQPLESKSEPNLYQCPDCKKEVSVHAESCPHCGASLIKKKRHGVFYFVFWGVISLVVTILILSFIAIMIPAIAIAIPQAAREIRQRNINRETVVSTTPKTPQLTPEEISTAKAIIAKAEISNDEVEGVVWLHPTEKSNIRGNRFYLYIGIHEGSPFMHLNVGYAGKDWLFVEKLVLRIDDQVESIDLSNRFKRETADGVCYEWFDEPAEPFLLLLRKIVEGNKVICRYEGDKDQIDKTISLSTKENLAKMMLVYRYLKERPTSDLLKLKGTQEVHAQRNILMNE